LRGRYYFIEPYLVEDDDSTDENRDSGGGDEQGGPTTMGKGHKGQKLTLLSRSTSC
jgi:hypothetical protein